MLRQKPWIPTPRRLQLGMREVLYSPWQRECTPGSRRTLPASSEEKRSTNHRSYRIPIQREINRHSHHVTSRWDWQTAYLVTADSQLPLQTLVKNKNVSMISLVSNRREETGRSESAQRLCSAHSNDVKVPHEDQPSDRAENVSTTSNANKERPGFEYNADKFN